MATYTTSGFKPGLKFMQDGEPCVIVENEFVKPGKGQAFTRTRIRKLISGKVLDVNFKSGTSVEAADVMDLNLTYSYKDDAFWYFMHPETFEQYSADRSEERRVGKECRARVVQYQYISKLPSNSY